MSSIPHYDTLIFRTCGEVVVTGTMHMPKILSWKYNFILCMEYVFDSCILLNNSNHYSGMIKHSTTRHERQIDINCWLVKFNTRNANHARPKWLAFRVLNFTSQQLMSIRHSCLVVLCFYHTRAPIFDSLRVVHESVEII